MVRTRRAFLETLPLAIAALLPARLVLAQSPPSAQDFAGQLAVATMFGIESATLALQKSSSPAIKDYAHRLADDHARAASQLRRIVARRSDIALPDRPDGRHLDMIRDLGALQGEAFDKAYAAAQREAHRELAALLEAYARNGADPELKAFATETLPLVQDLSDKAGALTPRP
ncbi:DUF4142 domain-containing protein [Bosea sp. (in: a-proteobacteria)]|uniref:DUF4142 domain-containing protein n=1 Tax=Bosea sp. (in: a-proteobacteria) TaxID=1871050 RepID=UPI00333F5E9F